MGRRYRSTYSPAEKNYILTNQDGITSGNIITIDVVNADDASNEDSVKYPCRVKAVFVTCSVGAATLATGSFCAASISKSVGGVGRVLNPAIALTNDAKSRTFWWIRMAAHISTRPLKFVGWVRIPKRWQIFMEADRLVWNVTCTSVGFTWEHCSNFVYKWRQ